MSRQRVGPVISSVVLIAVIAGACASGAESVGDAAVPRDASAGSSDDLVRQRTAGACLRSRGFDIDDASVFDPERQNSEEMDLALYGDANFGASAAWRPDDYHEISRELEAKEFRPDATCEELANVAQLIATTGLEAFNEPLEITDEMLQSQAEVDDKWEACAESRGFDDLRSWEDASENESAELDALRERMGVDIFELRAALSSLAGPDEPRELTALEEQYLVKEDEVRERHDTLVAACDGEVADLVFQLREEYGLNE